MKHCARCNTEIDTKFCYCKECRKIYDRERYLANKELMIQQRRDYRKDKRDYLREYKSGRKCEYCPENDWRCLDFHHLNPEEKEFCLNRYDRSKESLEKEIAKCILICANCHRKLHIPEHQVRDGLEESYSNGL